MHLILAFIVYMAANSCLATVCDVISWQYWAINACMGLMYIIGAAFNKGNNDE